MWRVVAAIGAATTARRVVVALRRAVRAAGNLFSNSLLFLCTIATEWQLQSDFNRRFAVFAYNATRLWLRGRLAFWLGLVQRGAASLRFKATSISIFRFGHEVFCCM